MSFVYSLISRQPDVILCEYTEYTGNFMQISRMILQNGIKTDSKHIINYDKYKIQYINENSYTYLTLTEEVDEQSAFAFLTEIKNEVLKEYNYNELNNFSTYQFTKGNEILKKYTGYYNTHPMVTKAGEIIKDLTLAKDAIIENIDKLIDRDNKMSIIAHKSNNLKDMSINISSVVDNIRKKETSRKNKYVVFAVILVGILIILFLFLT